MCGRNSGRPRVDALLDLVEIQHEEADRELPSADDTAGVFRAQGRVQELRRLLDLVNSGGNSNGCAKGAAVRRAGRSGNGAWL